MSTKSTTEKMPKRLLLPLFSFCGALYGLYHFLNSVEENACDMTYMFEYPEYLKIPLSHNSTVKFPRYNLYIYAEGKYGEDLRASQYRGVPVLFIPGNAGSHRQVRSLASVALRMSQSRQTNLHFNFFAIDFNEEISALYGGILNEQLEFVYESIKHIQSLYSPKRKLILIGHSMGGVIAKAVFSLPSFDPSDVYFILTLASPHRKPVISMDSDIVALYQKISFAWRYRLKAELRNIPIISVGGGQRDTIVRSELIYNRFEHSCLLDVHALTTSIPGVWLSTDHLAIVWCKQLVLTIVRSLFDLSQLQENEANKDLAVVENVLKFHYISKSSSSSVWSIPWNLPTHSFTGSGQWIEHDEKTWRFSRTKVLSSVYILIPFSKSGNILIVASGLVKGDWIFGCTRLSKGGQAKTCAEGENLSHHGEIIPSRKTKLERRMIHLKIDDLQQKKYLSLLIYVAPVNSQVEILSEVYSESDRRKHYELPLLERIYSLAPHRIFTVSLVDQVVYYNVTVSQSVGIFQTVEFQLETRLCRAGSVVGQGFVKVSNSWSGEVTYYHIRTSLGGITHIPAIVHSLPPADAHSMIRLEFVFDPECSIVFSAKFPLNLMASQFMKFYGTYAVGYSVAVLLMLISSQLNSVGQEGQPSSVYGMLMTPSSFVHLVVLPSILYHLLWISGFSLSPPLKPDELDESYNFLPWFLLRTLLYLIGSGFILFIYFCIELLLRVISACVIWCQPKSLLKTTQVPLERLLKDHLQISKTVLVCSSVIAAVCVGISSSLATLMAFLYYFIKLASIYTRCQMEEERRGPSPATSKWRFHSLLVMLWLFVFLFTFPGLIMWLKTVKFSLKLAPDIYILPCGIMVMLAAVFWQLPSPVIHRYKYKMITLLVKGITLVATLYGISSVYRLLYYMSVVFSVICFQQTLGYFREYVQVKTD